MCIPGSGSGVCMSRADEEVDWELNDSPTVGKGCCPLEDSVLSFLLSGSMEEEERLRGLTEGTAPLEDLETLFLLRGLRVAVVVVPSICFLKRE